MNFRRWITALAVLALFAGVASAQFQTLSTVNCSVSVASTPTVRSEGIGEKVGDILISCGNSTTPPVNGSAVDRGTLLVDFGAPITSRIDSGAVNNVGHPSEIVLTFDEPGAGNGPVANYGQNAAASVCKASDAQLDQANVITYNSLNESSWGANLYKCRATLYNVVNQVGSYWVLDSGAAVLPGGNFTAAGQAANVYQGAVGGALKVGNTTYSGWSHTANQVMFYDVPILPSGASNLTHLFRITNVRITPGALANITATMTPTTLAVSGSPVTGSRWQYALAGSPIVATAATSLSTGVNSLAASLCTTTALIPQAGTSFKSNLALINFREAFSGAFKTRVLSLNNAGADAEGNGMGAVPQNKTSGTYTITVGTSSVTVTTATSESGYIPSAANATILAVGGGAAGLADTGTRLKAVFSGLDANAKYYVSLTPVVDFSTPATFAGTAGDLTQTAWAVLQSKGTGASAADETAAYTPAGADATGPANNTIPVAQVFRATDGTGTVIWEVTNTAPGTPANLTFAVYAVYNLVTPPTQGNTAKINLGYSATTSTTSTQLPRFVALSSSNAQTFFNVLPCQTVLMFPYVTTISGYETGISIANTSKDPFGTPQTNGVCNLTFYGANQPAAAMSLWDPAVADGSAKTINAGTIIANTATNILNPPGTVTPITNFNGYAIAVCNFRFAHGFAFVQNRAQTLGMGYLPLVVDTTLNSSNGARGSAILGEAFNQ